MLAGIPHEAIALRVGELHGCNYCTAAHTAKARMMGAAAAETVTFRNGEAEDLSGTMVADFWDEKNVGFFYTLAAHKDLLVRTKPFYDGAVPSGNSTATLVLLKLSKLLDNAGYYQKAEAVLTAVRDMMSAQPRAYLNLLCAADFYLQPTREIAIVGRPDDADTQRLLELIHGRFIPNKIIALAEPDGPAGEAAGKRIPLLSGKTMLSGKATVYVCENYACKQPVTDAAALNRILDERVVIP